MKQSILEIEDGPDITFTRAFPDGGKESTRRKVRRILRYFPEFDGYTFRIGLTETNAGVAPRPRAKERDTRTVYIRLTVHVSDWTIAHEFTHQVHAHGLAPIPAGEKACDLFTLARSPDLLECEPCYINLTGCKYYFGRMSPLHNRIVGHRKELHELAKEAIRRRNEEGLRHYIKWFETEAAALVRGPHR